jgi:hypothetical protein
VGDLKTLEAVAAFGFFTDNIKDRVNKFSAFGVMTLGPIVTSTSLTKDKVVWSKKLTEWSSTDGVHSAWLKIHKDGTWDITTTCSFVKVHINTL